MRRCSGRSVGGFKENNDARRFGFVRSRAGKGTIAPARKAHNFAGWNFPFRRFGGLQYVETAVIKKERMIPKYGVHLGNRRMVVGQNLSLELVQGLFNLCRIQLHSLTPVLPSAADGALQMQMWNIISVLRFATPSPRTPCHI